MYADFGGVLTFGNVEIKIVLHERTAALCWHHELGVVVLIYPKKRVHAR